MADLSQPNNPFYNADDHLSRLLAEQVEEPWYRSFIQNMRETINPPKLPPLEVTSKPVAVKDIWGLYGRQKKSFMMSTGFQIGVVVLLFTVTSRRRPCRRRSRRSATLFTPVDIAPYQPKDGAQKAGDGWRRWRRRPFSPARQQGPAAEGFPAAVHSADGGREQPQSQADDGATIIAPPDVNLPNVNMAQYGDPLGEDRSAFERPGFGRRYRFRFGRRRRIG